MYCRAIGSGVRGQGCTVEPGVRGQGSRAEAYQLADLHLQVLDAVQLPLAAALGGDAVLAAPPHVVDELQLLRAQLVHLDQDLEVVAGQVGDLVHREGQLHLQNHSPGEG